MRSENGVQLRGGGGKGRERFEGEGGERVVGLGVVGVD